MLVYYLIVILWCFLSTVECVAVYVNVLMVNFARRTLQVGLLV